MADVAASDKLQACVQQLQNWVQSADLSDDARSFCDASTLQRYAIARNHDHHAAISNLKDTIAWRKSHVPAQLHCTACDVDPHMHAFFPIGLDKHNRFVIYACPSRAKTNDTDVTVRHMVHTLEHAFRSTAALGLHHQWVWLVDFQGFGLWHAMQGKTSITSLQAFSHHMPERLGCVLLVNPPSIFDLLLTVVKTVADARTMSKVHVLRCTPETAPAELLKHGIEESSGIPQWFAEIMRLPGKPGSLPSMECLHEGHLKALTLPRMPIDGGKQASAPSDVDENGHASADSGPLDPNEQASPAAAAAPKSSSWW